MRSVVDASVLLALALPLPCSDAAAEVMGRLTEAGPEIYSPALLEYEVVSALRRAVSRGALTDSAAGEALERLLQLRITPITPSYSLDHRALDWSSRLGHSKAYDAQYLALAEEMHCDLWTADRRLHLAARALGARWVCFVGEEGSARHGDTTPGIQRGHD